MTMRTTTRAAAPANDDLRPRVGTGVPLFPVPSPALPAWNKRIARWAAAA